jgi:PhnB protein
MTSTTKSPAGKVKPIPEGYHTATPYLVLNNASQAIDFYKKAFGAQEIMRMPGPGGKIMHAEIKIGTSPIMLADENPQMNARSPKTIGGSPISIYLYVENCDEIVKRAVDSGAKLVRPVENQFYGDRSGGVEDPFGYQWYIATHVEDVSPEELKKRAEQMHKHAGGGCCGG